MSKRLVLCCDGTWNTPDQTTRSKPRPTNVTKLALAVTAVGADGKEQRIGYHRGVGTGRWDHLTGGAFGVGLSQGVIDTYRFIVENYDPEDELFFFGFSRGAFTARSTAGLVRNAGILRRENLDRINDAYALYRSRRATTHPRTTESELFRRSFSHQIAGDSVPRIRFIGVWDTVGALGIPVSGLRLINLLNKRWEFHDTQLSSYVDAAFHALAIDERRGPFKPTPWTNTITATQRVMQVWFPGVHCDVGGGYPQGQTGLPDITLNWMAERARENGLTLDKTAFSIAAANADDEPVPFAPDALANQHQSRRGIYRLTRQCVRELGNAKTVNEFEASTTADRVRQRADYRPPNLLAWKNSADHVTDTEVG